MLPNLSALPRVCVPVGIPVPSVDHPAIAVEREDCVICLEPLVPDDPNDFEEVEALECVHLKYRHQFHLQCLLEHFDHEVYEHRCPICRTDMTTGEVRRLADLLSPMPAAPPTPAAQPTRPTRPVREKAFLYVIVRNLGFGGATNRSGAHLLLIGHKQRNSFRRWGVPGGLRDRSDRDAVDTATREFLEEMGIAPRPSSTDIRNAVGLLQAHGLQTVVRTNRSGFSAHAVVFDTALEFERSMGLTTMLRRRGVRGVPRIDDKYTVDLSGETQGYTYVPLQQAPAPPLATATVRTNQGEQYQAVRSASGLNNRQLRLRRGVSERALRAGRAMV